LLKVKDKREGIRSTYSRIFEVHHPYPRHGSSISEVDMHDRGALGALYFGGPPFLSLCTRLCGHV
jgi:hypothetical protein